VFVVHLSKSANEGHYITYSNCNGIWSEYNDADVTSSVDIDGIKDKAYYYCYRATIKDYGSYIMEAAKANIIHNECEFCHETIIGIATYHVPGTADI
jgi:hypothetical protein